MSTKNVETIKLLVTIALTEGDYLEENWTPVLQCISQLARLQLYGQGLQRDEVFFRENDTPAVVGNHTTNTDQRRSSARSSLSAHANADVGSGNNIFKFFAGTTKAEAERLVEEGNAQIVSQTLSAINIDSIFLNSQYLSPDAVQYFINSLCEVSMLEISSIRSMLNLRSNKEANNGKDDGVMPQVPRVFSLQKLVEVAGKFGSTTSYFDFFFLFCGPVCRTLQ